MVNLSTHTTNANSQNANVGATSNVSPSSNNSDNQTSALSNLSHLSQPTKKESNLLSWFHLSSSTTSAGGGLNTASLGARQQQHIEIAGGQGESVAGSASPPLESLTSPSPQSMKSTNKTNFGEIFYKQKLKEQVSSQTNEIVSSGATSPTVGDATKQAEPPKYSRRTTSLLNLFMSNSQGNITIHEFPYLKLSIHSPLMHCSYLRDSV